MVQGRRFRAFEALLRQTVHQSVRIASRGMVEFHAGAVDLNFLGSYQDKQTEPV